VCEVRPLLLSLIGCRAGHPRASILVKDRKTVHDWPKNLEVDKWDAHQEGWKGLPNCEVADSWAKGERSLWDCPEEEGSTLVGRCAQGQTDRRQAYQGVAAVPEGGPPSRVA